MTIPTQDQQEIISLTELAGSGLLLIKQIKRLFKLEKILAFKSLYLIVVSILIITVSSFALWFLLSFSLVYYFDHLLNNLFASLMIAILANFIIALVMLRKISHYAKNLHFRRSLAHLFNWRKTYVPSQD